MRCCKAAKEGCIERGFVSVVKFVTALVAVLATGGCAMSATTSAGSCALPRPVLSAQHASPGQKLTVSIDFSLTCQDTNHAEAAITQAWKSVRIRLVEGNTDMVLATLDTDRAGHLSTQVTIPVKASAGLALIRIDYADDVPLTIN